MPVISSAENRGLPSSSLTVISTSSMSRSLLSAGGLADAAVHDVLHQAPPTLFGPRRGGGSSRWADRRRRRPAGRCRARARGRGGRTGRRAGRGTSCRSGTPTRCRWSARRRSRAGRSRRSRPSPAIIRRTSFAMVAAWPLMCLSRSAALCSISLRRSGLGVEHHALAEDRRHERVRLGLVEVVVGRPEEELVGLRPGQEDDLLVGQPERCRRRRTPRGPVSSARSGRCGTLRGGRVRPRRRTPAGQRRVSFPGRSLLPFGRHSGIPSSPSFN